jgi:hypothetical protein
LKEIAMSRSLGETFADSLKASLGYAERLLNGIQADQFARLAAPGGFVVQSNHPAFVYGHLALYPPRILGYLGESKPTVKLLVGFEEAFSKDASCRDDAEGRIYPSMDEITGAFFTGYRAVLERLPTASGEKLDQPNPLGGQFAERFPTIGSMMNFYLGGHMMFHLGQLSAWRRMMGLAPA